MSRVLNGLLNLDKRIVHIGINSNTSYVISSKDLLKKITNARGKISCITVPHMFAINFFIYLGNSILMNI